MGGEEVVGLGCWEREREGEEKGLLYRFCMSAGFLGVRMNAGPEVVSRLIE